MSSAAIEEELAVKKLFDIADARKAFLILYDKTKHEEKKGNKYSGMGFNQWAVTATMNKISRHYFIEYLAAYKRLGLVVDSGLTDKPIGSRMQLTERGYKAGDIVTEDSVRLASPE